jgi:hypothetical protein
MKIKYAYRSLFMTASLLLVSTSFSVGENGLFNFGGKKNKEQAASVKPQDHIDRLSFWQTVVSSLKKNGYKDDSAEIKHAERYLHRAQRHATVAADHSKKASAHKSVSKKDNNTDTKQHEAKVEKAAKKHKRTGALSKKAKKLSDHKELIQE